MVAVLEARVLAVVTRSASSGSGGTGYWEVKEVGLVVLVHMVRSENCHKITKKE